MFLNFFVDEAQIEKKNIMSMRQLVELSVRKIIWKDVGISEAEIFRLEYVIQFSLEE